MSSGSPIYPIYEGNPPQGGDMFKPIERGSQMKLQLVRGPGQEPTYVPVWVEVSALRAAFFSLPFSLLQRYR